MRCSVFLADDSMSVNLRLPVFEGDISNQRKKLYLLVQLNGRLILLVLPTEPTQRTDERAPTALKLAADNCCSIANRFNPSASSSPVSKIRMNVSASGQAVCSAYCLLIRRRDVAILL
jgi:hypothetical protein